MKVLTRAYFASLAPPTRRTPVANFAPFDLASITAATGVTFFSFVGLDSVAAAGEEAKNPRRNLPLAIMIALGTVTCCMC